MQYYIQFNPDSTIFGFYVDEIHGDNIPSTAKPITVDEWRTYSAAAHLYRLDGETIRLKTQAELDAEEANRPPAPKSDIDELKSTQADILLAMVMNDLM